MPLYEYWCLSCGNKFDKMVPMAQYKRKQTCLECGRKAHKLISVPAVYGTVKYHDKVLADAAEAAHRPMMSTKDVDKAEKAGEMYAITNPSRHRKLK